MGFPVGLCVSPAKPVASGGQKDKGGSSENHTDRSVLAPKGLVLLAQDHVGGRPLGTARHPGPTSSRSDQPSTSEGSTFDGLVFERSLLKNRGFSPNLIDTLMKSRKLITTKIYSRTWRKFLASSNFNIEEGLPINQILEFLQRGLELNLSTSTLKVQVSALGALFSCNIAGNYWVSRFIKAASRSRPIHRNRSMPWDLNLVLSALTKEPFEPLHSASLKLLSLKTAFLVAITSARRVGDIQALSRLSPYTEFLQDRVVLRPDPAYLPKVASEFHRSQEIVLPSFLPNPSNSKEELLHTLDVRRCLLEYISVTDAWKREEALFLSFQGPRKGLRVSKYTLAKWIREAISLAYTAGGGPAPQNLRAHSTRAMAASWAERSGVSIDQICKAATWSSPSTFFKHYRLDLGFSSDLTFGLRVLQAIVPP
ncbi:uncharacterized protein [Ranitomeya imitator]|uniref:uncharacterized protein n=1 Tax=Ranitomeya imitator TaxID=111125 RepID=UPI0037E88A38